MNTIINSLTVLRGLKKDNLFSALSHYCCCPEADEKAAFNDLLYEIYNSRAENSVAGYIGELILTDDNVFSRTCARGETPSSHLLNAMAEDLKIIRQMLTKIMDCQQFELGASGNVFAGSKDDVLNNLKSFYTANGYGIFIRNKAFTYENGEFVPACNATEVTMEQLKNYTDEKRIIIENTRNFLGGLHYSHMLLYGDRGTGKSSTVHALINKFHSGKLRLIEVGNNNFKLLPAILRKLADNPMKFIIFLDDLSLDEKSEDIATLKTIFEGSFSNTYGNVMLAATSNRRHIVKENHTDRENSVHPSDVIDEQLSLSDRFGLTVMFSTTDKQAYLSIVDQLATDAKLKTDREKLHSFAERWAIVKGGRSPRRAKQFTDYVYACEQSLKEINF